MKRVITAFLASFIIILCTTASSLLATSDISSIVNTPGYINGYEAYLQTAIFSPPTGQSDTYISNYHDGYFRAVEEYNLGYDVGFAMGQYHLSQGWPKKTALYVSNVSLPANMGISFTKGLQNGYNDAYDKKASASASTNNTLANQIFASTTGTTNTSIRTGSSTTTPSASAQAQAAQEFALYQAISQNQELQNVIEYMQTTQHNNRCAEGVICMISALLGEDLRKYNNWSGLETNAGFPLITGDDMLNMLVKCGVYKEVDPNSPPKAFRVNDIEFANGTGGHSEMMGPDGNWYSDGREYYGAVQYDSTPKNVRSYDLDIPAYLNYIKSHTDPDPNFTEPFKAFYETDPNTEPFNDITSLIYG